MVIVREGRNANEIVVIAADVMQNIKSTKLAKKHFRLNFVSLFSSVLVQYSLKSILWNLFYSVVVILATSSGQ